MKKTLLSALAALSLCSAAFAQVETVDNTGIITFSGPGVTDGESPITLTYYPDMDCNADTASNLVNSRIVNFHGTVAIADAGQATGYAWQAAQQREWNKDAAGNTATSDAELNSLMSDGNGNWTMTFTPRIYFVNVPAGSIAAMQFVLNGNTLANPSWAKKGTARHLNNGVQTCNDFLVTFPIASSLLSAKSVKRVASISSQNQPNPFRGSTSISYTVRSGSNVSMKVFNILGEEVSTLVNEKKAAGTHRATFNAAGLNAGLYFYTTVIGDQADTKKMLLVD